jgi:hypothetical protein
VSDSNVQDRPIDASYCSSSNIDIIPGKAFENAQLLQTHLYQSAYSYAPSAQLSDCLFEFPMCDELTSANYQKYD